jgi:hypothetical protein
MPDAPLLPELARSLRTLGASRTPCDQEAHDAIFGPLIDARSRAVDDSLDKALAALKGAPLFTRIEAASVGAVSKGVSSAPRARALAALTREMLEPLGHALRQLDEAAAVARDSEDGVGAWIDSLRLVFRRADHACEALARLIAQRNSIRSPAGWFSRKG